MKSDIYVTRFGVLALKNKNPFDVRRWVRVEELHVPDTLDFWMSECLKRTGIINFNDNITNQIKVK